MEIGPRSSAETFYSAYGFVPLEALEGAFNARPGPFPMLLSMSLIDKAAAE